MRDEMVALTYLRRGAPAVPVVFALASTITALVLPPAVAAQVAPSKASTASATDEGWPRQYSSTEGKILFYQPQLDDWDGTRFTAHAAVAIERPGASAQTAPIYGVIWFSSNTEVDKDT